MLAKYHLTTADNVVKINKSDFESAMKVYSCLYYDSLGKAPHVSNEPKTRKLFNTVLKDFSMTQFIVIIFCHFEWYGSGGRQENDYTYLQNKGFPIELLISNRFKYAAYCKEIMGEIWDNDNNLRKVLDIWLQRLMTMKIA